MKLLLSFFGILFVVNFSISQTFELKINQGSGSGTYEKSKHIHIWADTPDDNQVFIGWTGNGIQYLASTQEWHTTLYLPTNVDAPNLSLKANYEMLDPDIQTIYDSITLWGEYNRDPNTRFQMRKPYYAVIPSTKPKGGVFLFHGTGGSAHSFFRKYEMRSLVNDLVHNNYAVFVLSSNETDLGDQDDNGKIRWNASPQFGSTENNIDLHNIQTFKLLIGERLKQDDLPFFSFGVSNGANFSDLSSAILDFKAAAHMTAHGNESLFKFYDDLKPNIWLQARNDNHPEADSNVAKSNYHQLIKKDITTEWHWLDRSPLYPLRFTRSSNQINNRLSIDIYNTVKSLNWLDVDGYLTFDAITKDSLNVLFKHIKLTAAQRKDVESQFKVFNAEHGGHGDYNKTIIAFYNQFVETVTANVQPINVHVDIRIFPNPCSNFLKIYTPHQISTISIFNAHGAIIKQKYYNQDIDVSDLQKGYYFIQIQTDEGTSNQRFIKS